MKISKHSFQNAFSGCRRTRRKQIASVCIGLISVFAPALTAQSLELGRSSITKNEEPALQTPDFHGHEPLAADCPWFNEFKRDISADPVDPRSEEMLARMIGLSSNVRVDFSGSWSNPEWNWYTSPIQVVSGDTPLSNVPGTWSYNPDSSGPYMLPPEPVVFQNSTRTTYMTEPWSTVDGGDHHLFVYVRDEATGGFKELWEYYQPWVTWNGDQIAALSGASWVKYDLVNGENPPAGTNSTNAAGTMIAPLRLNYNDIAGGTLNHALECQLHNNDISPTYKWPARLNAAAYNRKTGMPYGTRLRIKASWWDANADDVLGTGTQARILGEGMRRYGLIVADGTSFSTICLGGVADTRWESEFYDRLQDIPVSAFEVVYTPPNLLIEGPTELEIGQTGTWTMSHLPDESVLAEGYKCNINMHDSGGTMIQYQFATIDNDHRSVTSEYSFSAEGVYTIRPYRAWYTEPAGPSGYFEITVGTVNGVRNGHTPGISDAVHFITSADPFSLCFELHESMPVTVDIIGTNGRLVSRLLSGRQSAGTHTMMLSSVRGVPAGAYLCRLTAGEVVHTKKILRLQ